MNNETEKKLQIEEVLTPEKLKEITGEEGQYIKLVDVTQTEDIIKQLAVKYKSLEVTGENFKKEAAEAEKELRQTRYALQRIQKGNNQFINKVKKEEKELFDNLIGFIQPEEERLKAEILKLEEAERKAKEEAERKEKERIERINKALKDAEIFIESILLKGKTKEDLKKFDDFLTVFRDDLENFEELEFKAKRIYAVANARREELEQAVLDFERMEAEREALKAELEEQEKKKVKVLQMRGQILEKIGFKKQNGRFDLNGFYSFLEHEVAEADELKFFEIQQKAIEQKAKAEEKKEEEKRKKAEALKAEEQRAEEVRKQAEQDNIKQSRKAWDEMFTIFCGLGGDPTKFRLKSNEFPSKKDIKRLREETDRLHKKKREEEAKMKKEKAQEVKKELQPFVNEILHFMGEIENKVAASKFEHKETQQVLNSFISKSELLANTIFGEVYNK